MGKIVLRNQPCICGSSDARQVYEDGGSTCFSCKKSFRKGMEEIDESMPEVKAAVDPMILPILSIPEWKIRKEVCDFFGVRTEPSTPSKHYYPYGEGSFKVRIMPKIDFYWINRTKNIFGLDKFNGNIRDTIIICEGEKDALAVAEAQMRKYNKIYPVCGLSSSTAVGDLLYHRDKLRAFGKIVLCFDEDKAGDEARQEALRILGYDKCVVTLLPLNDAYDVLSKQGHNALMGCIFSASPRTPSGIVTKEALYKQVKEYLKIESIPYPACLSCLNDKARGIRFGEISLFVSGTSCLGLGTPVLMYDGSIKNVEDIRVGDTLMGDDSTPRNVLNLSRGCENLYRISIKDGTSFVCNESHIHSFVNNDIGGRWGLKKDQVVDVKISDYLKWSDKRKHLSKTFKANMLEFSQKEPVIIHPYILGVWLGDGYSEAGRLSASLDSIEMIEKLQSLGQPVVKNETKYSWGLPALVDKLRELNVLKNKHIPEEYLTASVKERMELLAGLVDTDGCLSVGGYEFSQKSEIFIDQFIRLARSLGFRATKGKQKNNKFGNCFRVWISGPHIHEIPVALSYKKIPEKMYRTDQRRFKTEIAPVGIGDFYGFELDGNQRFVLGNFTVTHNCGKSTLMRELMLHYGITHNLKVGIVSLEESPAETGIKLATMSINKNRAAVSISEEEIDKGMELVFENGDYMLLDHQGSINDMSIIDTLEYMCLSGCKILVIDHITILVSEGVDNLTGNEAVDKMTNHLLSLVKKYPVWIGLVSHLRKSPGGSETFEQGKMPSLDDIKGCLAYGTEVLLSNGKCAKVQDIKVGDMLMGDNSPRKVLNVIRGKQIMYKVTMKTSGDSFICNEDHILTLSHNNKVFDMSVKDFLSRSESFKSRCKQYYSTGYELPAQDLIIPPYSLGAWLGDGSKSAFRIMDAGRLGVVERVAGEINAELNTPGDISKEYFNFVTGIKGEMLSKLKKLGVYNNKHIPEQYRFSSFDDRRELLAGLLDTDGSYSKRDKHFYFYQKDKKLAEDVKDIARSLGLYSTLRENVINCEYSSNGSVCYQVMISGAIDIIPTQKDNFVERFTNPLKRGIIVEKLDIQDYYGFTLDGNGRFLLGNHIITHNSGSIKQICFDVFGFARNTMAEDEIERTKIKMACLKCRFTGLTGIAGEAYYDFPTGRYLQQPNIGKITKL